MRTNRWLSAALLWSSVAALPACALLGKNPPLVPRYFTAEVEPKAPKSEALPLADQRLRLGRVQASAHLRERMAYRTSEEEIGYYNELRWTERPEAYLRRALSRSLFEVRGITRAVSGAAPTLDAELVSFEEIKGDSHRVRVQVVMSLDDVLLGSVQSTVTVEREVAGTEKEDPTPVVQALAQALAQAVEQICDRVVARLAQLPPPQVPPNAPPAGTSTTTLTTESTPAPAKPQR
jgi:cholesterol transport system auxiliary component